MTKRYIAFTLCAAVITALALSFSSAGQSGAENAYNMTARNSEADVDVEIERNGLSEERAALAARVLSNISTEELLAGGSGWACDTDVAIETIAPGASADTDETTTTPCKGSHDLITTTAYYTQHLAFDDDPRCLVFTTSVTVCTKCSYMITKVISTERVSYCHPTHAIERSKGDVNSDGKVNAKDVVILMKHITGAALPDGVKIDKTAADMDSSGKINARDVTLLMKKIVNN